MTIFSTTGSLIHIGPAQSGDLDLAAYIAITEPSWVPIGEVSNLGAFGDTSSAITFSSIEDGRVRKMKGARDAGSIALTCGMDARDLGQQALSAAQATAFYYAFRVTASDKRLETDTPSIFYFNGLVDSEKMTFGANNVVVTIAYTININTEIIWTPSAVSGA